MVLHSLPLVLSGLLLFQAPAPVVAPVQTCGTDLTRAQAEPLTRESLLLAIDRRLFSPCVDGPHPETHLEQRDQALIEQALGSSNTELKRLAVQGLGRMASPGMVARLAPVLDDTNPTLRMTAANAIGQLLSGLRSDLRTDNAPTPAEVRVGRQHLEARFAKETDDQVAAVLLATMGRMRHAEDDLPAVEAWLTTNTAGAPTRLLGGAEGLRALAQRNPRRPLAEPTRVRLREISGLGRATTGAAGATLTQMRRVTMNALQVARDTDVVTMLEAAADPDWQVRRFAVLMMNPAIAQVRPAVLTLMKDPMPQVRFDAVAAFGRGLQTINDCAPLVNALTDESPTVALRAFDGLTAGCRDLPAIVSAVAAEADGLAKATTTTWHRSTRAFAALVRLAPEDGRARVTAARNHGAWQVRAAAAAAAGSLKDIATLVALAADKEPNVRTAAIDALARLKVADVVAPAMAALTATDHQLVRSAATALAGTTHPDAVEALFASLRRLTSIGADTSRDPRVAIVNTLAGVLGAARVGELAEWTADWDTAVRTAARNAFVAAKVEVPVRPRQYRYPAQPSADELRLALQAKEADIELASGAVVTIALLPAEAPMTVARFVSRARSGAYDGLTFHRVVPNFVIQGLSPGANEYMGDSRFMRDEAGLEPHSRGAVGISTRGYDTGDAQIFFDLVDLPRLNHDYTVFARVTSGMQHLDTMLEGAGVRRVVIR